MPTGGSPDIYILLQAQPRSGGLLWRTHLHVTTSTQGSYLLQNHTNPGPHSSIFHLKHTCLEAIPITNCTLPKATDIQMS